MRVESTKFLTVVRHSYLWTAPVFTDIIAGRSVSHSDHRDDSRWTASAIIGPPESPWNFSVAAELDESEEIVKKAAHKSQEAIWFGLTWRSPGLWRTRPPSPAHG